MKHAALMMGLGFACVSLCSMSAEGADELIGGGDGVAPLDPPENESVVESPDGKVMPDEAPLSDTSSRFDDVTNSVENTPPDGSEKSAVNLDENEAAAAEVESYAKAGVDAVHNDGE
jgi:hypothetical protein